MRILFFDDERWRHDLFESRSRGHIVHHAYTVRQFKGQLAGYIFNVISFDYDVCDKKSETGMDAVEALIAHPADRWPGKVIVHSWNSRGAGELMSRLREAGFDPTREPFATDTALRVAEAERRFTERTTVDEDEDTHIIRGKD